MPVPMPVNNQPVRPYLRPNLRLRLFLVRCRGDELIDRLAGHTSRIRPALIGVAHHGHRVPAVVVVANFYRIQGARPCTAIRQTRRFKTLPTEALV